MNSFTLPESLDAVFLSSPVSLFYLTHFDGLSAPTERTAYLFITKNSWNIISYSMYKNEIEMTISRSPHIKAQYISPQQSLKQCLADALPQLEHKQIGIEYSSLQYSEYMLLQQTFGQCSLTDIELQLQKLREIKTQEEIQRIQSASRITSECLSLFASFLHAGMSEYELAWNIEQCIREKHAELAFPPIVAFGKNSAQPHHKPDSHTLLNKEMPVLVDFGAKMEGYHADLSRSFWFGNSPDSEWQHAYNTVSEAKQKAETYISETTFPLGSEADSIARTHVVHKGYPSFPHGLGHGVGLEIHENPRLNQVRNDQILPNMVFTVEPAVYKDEKFGIRLEDTVLKTGQGIRILTESSSLTSMIQTY